MMNQNELVRLVNEMISAPSCCKELKDAGQNYLNALGTDAEKTAAAALLQEIREDVCTLDQTIPFFESELGTQIFGAERAKAMAAAGSDARMNGCELPVVINSGSGNQGITASVPIVAFAKELQVSEETMYASG